MENRPIEAVTTQCLCNGCEHAGGERVPDKVPFEFESFCGIAERDHEGRFVAGMVPPKYVKLGEDQEPDLKKCSRYRAFMEAMKLAA
jgi:hypothetical protein